MVLRSVPRSDPWRGEEWDRGRIARQLVSAEVAMTMDACYCVLRVTVS